MSEPTPELKPLHQLFYERVQEAPEKTALVLPEGTEVSRGELWEQACRVRAFLESKGVGPRDRVALIGVSTISFSAAIWGTLSLGATAVPLNYRLPEEELAWLIGDAGAKAILSDKRYLDVLEKEVKAEIAKGVPVVCFDGSWEGAASWQDVQKSEPTAAQRVPYDSPLEDIIYVLYTSGTTAKPKGVEEPHKGYAITAAAPSPIPPEAVVYAHALPLYHLAGLATLTSGMARGGRYVIMDRWDPEQFLQCVERFKCTVTFLVPTMMCDLVESGLLGKHEVSSMLLIAYGAAPTPTDVLIGMIEGFPKTFFMQVYTQTEGASRVTQLDPEDHKLSSDNPELRAKQIRRLQSIGKIAEGVEAKICDEEGKEVPQGEIGVLWYRTPGAMRGYMNRESETADTLREGWIVSGDMVRMDEDGYVYIVGRSKDFLIRGGENIAPREIEEVLESHPDVIEAAVVGKPHHRWGEIVVAFARCPERKPTEEALKSLCQAHLAGFKVPEKIWIRDELPRNSVGKILKRELAEEAKKLEV